MQSLIRNILHLNAWPDFDGELPRGARHLVNHELKMSVTVTEGLYLHETDDRHALWSVVGPRAGVVITADKSGSVREAAHDFFEILMRARVGYAWPAGVTRPGLIDEASYNAIVDKVTAELDSNAAISRSLPSDIISAAERLSLHPEPTGRGPHHWRANCPGRSHHLYIVASTNSFGCGWCREKGGTHELQALVHRRRSR